LKILNFEILKSKQSGKPIEQIPILMGQEISYADSPYFDQTWYKPYNPATLYQEKSNYDFYDDMRQDDQINSCLMLKKLIALNAPLEIETEEPEIKEFIEYCFNEFLAEPLIKKLYNILLAVDYGWSITEKIVSPCVFQGKQKWAFSELKTRAPHSFDLHSDEKGNLEFILQHTNKGELKFEPSKFIIYSYNKEFDNWYGVSDLNRGVYRAWWAKTALIKFWNIHLERYGSPLAVGKIPKTAGVQEKNNFKTILKNIQTKTGITLPEGFEIEYLMGASGQSSYKEAIDTYNTMIARNMLIPDLLGFSGTQTGGGSYALGKEQFNIFYTAIQYMRQDIEKIINKELIKPLVAWNYGSEYVVKAKFAPVDQDRKTEDMKIWLDAVKSGKIPLNLDSTNFFLNQLHFPEFPEDEFAKIEEEKQKLKEGLLNGQKNNQKQNNGNQESEKSGGNVPTPKENDEEKNNNKKNVQLPNNKEKEYVEQIFSRKLTPFEEKVDFEKIDKQLLEKEKQYSLELAKLFKLSLNALFNDIKEKKIIQNKRIEQIGKLNFKYKNKIFFVLKRLGQDGLKIGYQSAIKQKNYTFNDDIISLANNEDIAKWLSEYFTNFVDLEEIYILQETKAAVLDGIRQGLGVKDVLDNLDDKFGVYGSEHEGKIYSLVRTNLNLAFNQGRAMQFSEISDEIIGYQYSANLDEVTCKLCAALDKKIYLPDKFDYFNPPKHLRCRCIAVPILKEEKVTMDMLIKDDPSYVDIPETVPEKYGFIRLKNPQEVKIETDKSNRPVNNREIIIGN